MRLGEREQHAADAIALAFAIETGAPHSAQTEEQRINLVMRYRSWRLDLDGTPELDAAIALVLDERPACELSISATIRALRHYAAMRVATITPHPAGANVVKLALC